MPLSGAGPGVLALVRRWGADGLAGAFAFSSAVAVGGAALGTGFPLDDAWIHMVYGLGLRTGGSLAYNDGHSATGCTSPLWAAVAAAAHLLAGAAGPSLRAARVLQALGIAAHVAQAVVAARLARALASSRRAAPMLAVAAGAVVAGAPTLGFAAVSGMEIPLEGALLLGAMLATVRRRWWTAGALAGTAALARPEGVLAVVAVTATALAFASWRAALRAGGTGAVPVLALGLRNWLVSGRPLPATFYVKANPGAQGVLRSLTRGLVETLGHVAPASNPVFWVLVGAALALGARALWRRKAALRTGTLGATAALGLTYAGGISALSFFENPTSFYYQRYVLPALGVLIVSALAAASRVVRWRRLAHVPGVALVPPVLGLLGLATEVADAPAARARFATDVDSTNAQQVAIGRWIDATLAPDAVVWTIDAGAIRYWGRRRTVDLIRLNTPDAFDGARVERDLWPSAIAIIPSIFQIATSGPPLEMALAAESATATARAREAWRQEVHVCHSTSRVLVLYERTQVIADGRCAPR